MKKNYFAPAMQVVAVATEGMICTSGEIKEQSDFDFSEESVNEINNANWTAGEEE